MWKSEQHAIVHTDAYCIIRSIIEWDGTKHDNGYVRNAARLIDLRIGVS
jgi:hypothetical protein